MIIDEQVKASVRFLNEMLPYVQKFQGKRVVVKYGGNAMIDTTLKNEFAQNVVLLKNIGIHPIIVHGGGAQINTALQNEGVQPHWIDGLRVTDEATMQVVERVLVHEVNREIVDLIRANGGNAFGLGGRKNGQLITAKKMESPLKNINSEKPVDIGYVGSVKHIDTYLLRMDAGNDGWIPVIAPVGISEDGHAYNVNGDTVAGHIAEAIQAEKFLILTNTHGVEDNNGELLKEMPASAVPGFIESGVIRGGMLPKIACVVHALECGVKTVHIIDGRVENSLLLEIFTDAGIGTLIYMDEEE